LPLKKNKIAYCNKLQENRPIFIKSRYSSGLPTVRQTVRQAGKGPVGPCLNLSACNLMRRPSCRVHCKLICWKCAKNVVCMYGCVYIWMCVLCVLLLFQHSPL